MKKCASCKQTKSRVSFGKLSRSKDGLKYSCKECRNNKGIKYREENKEYMLTKEAIYREENRERLDVSWKIWRLNNLEHHRKYARDYQKRNKGKVNYYTRRRQKRVKMNTPKWLSDFDKEYIKALYIQAAELTRITGERHEVHHNLPLQEFKDKFIGLQVPWNLEVLTKEEHLEAHIQLRKEHGRK